MLFNKLFTISDDDIESYDSNSDIDDEEVEVKVLLIITIFFFVTNKNSITQKLLIIFMYL